MIELPYFICWQQPLVKVVNQSSASSLATIWQKHVFLLHHLSLLLTLLVFMINQVITMTAPFRLWPFHHFSFSRAKREIHFFDKHYEKVGEYFTRYKCSWKYWKYFYRAPLGMWNKCPQLWRDRCVFIIRLLIEIEIEKGAISFHTFVHSYMLCKDYHFHSILAGVRWYKKTFQHFSY